MLEISLVGLIMFVLGVDKRKTLLFRKKDQHTTPMTSKSHASQLILVEQLLEFKQKIQTIHQFPSKHSTTQLGT